MEQYVWMGWLSANFVLFFVFFHSSFSSILFISKGDENINHNAAMLNLQVCPLMWSSNDKDKKANSKRLRKGHGGCHVSGYVTSICTDSLLTFPSPPPLLLSSLVHLPTLLGHFMPFLSSVLEWAGLIFEEMGHTWSVSDRARTSAIYAFQ